jgi:uncharacterized protein YndB with AHSA1/START domain
MRTILLFLTVALASVAPAAAGQVADTSYKAADGTRVLRHDVVVPASTAEVYTALTTAEGWRTWAVPFAVLTPAFGAGAILETSYNPNAKPGEATNIKNRVLAYIPERMFAFQAVQAPAGFKHAELLAHIFTVAELERVGAKRTRVRLSMLGYGQGPAFDELYGFFAKGNAWTMEKLAERFEKGPIDWAKAKAASKN